MIVGTGVPDGPKRADMESAPTDLNVVLNLMPVGEGLAPPVVFRTVKDAGPYRFVRCLLFLV